MSRIEVLVLIFICVKYSQASDFPSLLVANATIGVIVHHEYLGDKYESTIEALKEIIERVIREDLRGAGLNVKYFSWSRINFNKDLTAIFSIASCASTWETFKHVQRERLLLIAITDPDCPRLPLHEALTIPRIKIGVELPQILLDIRTSSSVNWKSTTILYDDTFDRDTISRVATALSLESESSALTISLLKMNISTDVYERRENIKKSLMSFPTRQVGYNFLVIASNPTTVIEVATEMNMMDTTSQWLFLVSNPRKTNVTQLTSHIKEGGNVAIASNNTITNGICTIQQECLYHELFKNFAMAISKLVREEEAIYTQISDEEWETIRLTKRERRDNMLEFIKDRLRENQVCKPCVNWKFEATETWGLRFDTNEDIVLSGKLKPYKPIVTAAAMWEPTNGFIHYDYIFPHIAHGFRNRTVRIATYNNPPWQFVNYNEAGEVTSMRGITMKILDELAVKLNFTYVVHNVERNSNRTAYSFWDDFNVTMDDDIKSTFQLPSDILELIADNMVLFGATALTVHETYEKLMNFTFPISVQSYGMMIPRPKELSRLYLFIAPFTLDTWICLTATIVLIGPLFYGIHFLSSYHEHHQITKKGGLFKIQNCFWYMYGALLQQGGMYLPRSDSGRIIVGTWWLVVLVIVTTYCGNLVAFLTFPKMEISVNTLDQLVYDNHEYTWSIRANTYLESYLKEIEKYIKLNESAETHDSISNATIARIKNGKHIIIDWETNLLHVMRKEYLESDKCEFTMSTERFIDERIGLVLPANSPYLKIFNNEIYRLLQMGFIQKWLSDYLPKKDRCSSKLGAMEIENHTVNLLDMQGCFLVLLAGVVAAIIIIFCECLCKRYKVLDETKLIKPFVK